MHPCIFNQMHTSVIVDKSQQLSATILVCHMSTWILLGQCLSKRNTVRTKATNVMPQKQWHAREYRCQSLCHTSAVAKLFMTGYVNVDMPPELLLFWNLLIPWMWLQSHFCPKSFIGTQQHQQCQTEKEQHTSLLTMCASYQLSLFISLLASGSSRQ